MKMKAHEVMSCPVVSVCRETSVAEVARVMADQRVGCVVVVDRAGKLSGIVTQTDFGDDKHGAPFSMEALLQKFSRSMPPEEIDKVRRDARSRPVEEIMVTEVIAAPEDAPLEEMARLMLRYDIDHIPIVRDGAPVGVVGRHDFLRMIAEKPKL